MIRDRMEELLHVLHVGVQFEVAYQHLIRLVVGSLLGVHAAISDHDGVYDDLPVARTHGLASRNGGLEVYVCNRVARGLYDITNFMSPISTGRKK